MKSRGGPPERVRLSRYWRRWIAVVDLFARRSPARRRVSPAEYEQLHGELLAACRSLADAADGEAQKGFYRRLENLAEPWLTLAALERADPRILSDLATRCREAQRELAGRTGSLTEAAATVDAETSAQRELAGRTGRLAGLEWAVAGLAFLVTFAGVILLGWKAPWVGAGWSNWAHDWANDGRLALRNVSVFQVILLIGAVLTPLLIYLVWRTTRRG